MREAVAGCLLRTWFSDIFLEDDDQVAGIRRLSLLAVERDTTRELPTWPEQVASQQPPSEWGRKGCRYDPPGQSRDPSRSHRLSMPGPSCRPLRATAYEVSASSHR